jgi:hypothetical protein
MRPEPLRRALLVALLLAAGLTLALLRPAPHADPIAPVPRSIWSTRRADLAIQVGLMLVGALGIRALLPGEGDEDAYEPEETFDEPLD